MKLSYSWGVVGGGHCWVAGASFHWVNTSRPVVCQLQGLLLLRSQGRFSALVGAPLDMPCLCSRT